MPLREELRSNGEWLFRWRSYLPLVLFALVLPAMIVSRAATGDEGWMAWDLFCLAVGVAGEVIRVLTVGFVPGGTSGRNTAAGQVAKELNTTGIYSVVRHPLYLGNFLMWMGPALLPANAWLAVTVVLAFWLYYERIMFAEEEFLRGTYGERYVEWASHTPAFIPRLSGWRAPTLPFSLRTVLRRELSSAFGLVSVFTVLELAGDFGARGRAYLDPVWVSFFLAGFAGFLVLVVLKKSGRLDVAGR
jgi:protein-S-isoprenylcysteine O-methyltransferase Ste14